MSYTIGNTVRITGTFENWDGEATDPPDVKFTVYDGNKEVVEEVEDEEIEKVSDGTYRYHYTIPADPPGPLHFEFSSPSAPDGPIVSRTRVDREW